MSIDEKAVFLHKQWNGKIKTCAKAPVKSREDLAIAYTPGVAAPCRIIAEDKEAVYTYTLKANTVAVVSDGSAVLGLGNIGPEAAMPCYGGQMCPLQRVWRYQCFSYLPVNAGSRRDCCRSQGDRTDLWWH